MWFKTILRPDRRRQRESGTFTVDEALLRRLERLALESQRTLRGTPISGEHPSNQILPTTIFSDHRPYSPGDDYRTVDWNAYARHEQIVVKLGEIEQDIDIHIMLDCSSSMAWGTPTKLDAARHLAAAIGYVALAQHDRLRVTPFGPAARPSFGPSQGKGRAIELLRFVAGVRAEAQTALARVLADYAKRNERGGLLVICSDLLAAPADGLMEGLRALPPPRWQVLVLHLLDPRELHPSLSGPLELEDSETGQRLALVLDDETIAAYQRNVTAWQEQIAEACVRRGATYAQIMTDWPLERAILPYLRVRRIVRRRT